MQYKSMNFMQKSDIDRFFDLNELERTKYKDQAQKQLKSLITKDENLKENLFTYIKYSNDIKYRINDDLILDNLNRKQLISIIQKGLINGDIFSNDLNIDDELNFNEIINELDDILNDFENNDLLALICKYKLEAIDDQFYDDFLIKDLGLESNYVKLNKNNSNTNLVTPNYSTNLINISNRSPSELLDYWRKVRDYLYSNQEKEFNNYSILFEGPPGVGKTEFAKYIGNQLNLHFSYISFGSLSSGYHGETEANIKNFFEEAEENESLVFIDEADSFLNERKNANQSFEISIVNEMLQQIERYPGIVICSTNLISNLDSAAMRRFAEKITFNFLSDDQKIKAFEIYFKNKLNKTEEIELQKINYLSIGDYKVVRQRTIFQIGYSNLDLIKELKKEIEYRNMD